MQKFLRQNNISSIRELTLKTFIEIDEEQLDFPLDLNLTFRYKLTSCEHECYNQNKLSNIISEYAKGNLRCRICESSLRYQQKLGIALDFDNHTFECLFCDTLYKRDPKRFLYNINHFKCYCKSKRSHEGLFYKKLYERIPNLHRSYSRYGTGLNHSSDFYLPIGDKTLIIHLDDNSHKIKLNQSRDLYKLEICLNKPNLFNLYIQQELFMENQDVVIDTICEIVNGETMTQVNTLSNNKTFYRYIKDFMKLQENDENQEN